MIANDPCRSNRLLKKEHFSSIFFFALFEIKFNFSRRAHVRRTWARSHRDVMFEMNRITAEQFENEAIANFTRNQMNRMITSNIKPFHNLQHFLCQLLAFLYDMPNQCVWLFFLSNQFKSVEFNHIEYIDQNTIDWNISFYAHFPNAKLNFHLFLPFFFFAFLLCARLSLSIVRIYWEIYQLIEFPAQSANRKGRKHVERRKEKTSFEFRKCTCFLASFERTTASRHHFSL